MSTTPAPGVHTPDEAFRDYLEGELIHALRRGRTFRRLRAAAVIFVSIGIGMTTTLASAQVRGNAQRDSLLETANADAMIASARLLLARTQLAEEQKQVSVGARSTASLALSEQALGDAEAEVARTILNIREIQATSLPPRDELNAPLIKGEDFVKQRLEAQMMSANRRLQTAERHRDDAARRVGIGAAPESELGEAELNLLRARTDLVILIERGKARKDFLEKGTTVEELTRQVERVEVQHAAMIAQRALTNAQQRLDLLHRRERVGAATKLEVLKAEVELQERQLELQRLARRLQQIR